MSRTALAAALLLACAACTPARKGTPSLPSRDAPPSEALRGVRRDPVHISPDEIRAATGPSNAYELIRRLRPRWFRTLTVGRNTSSTVRVEVDGHYAGGVEVLRQIAVDAIVDLRYRDAFDATGRGAESQTHAGTIAISTIRRT